jgi:hypothetical protein
MIQIIAVATSGMLFMLFMLSLFVMPIESGRTAPISLIGAGAAVFGMAGSAFLFLVAIAGGGA